MFAPGSVDVDRGAQLYADLSAARRHLCLANHLHLLYLVTPYDAAENLRPDWMLFMDEVSGRQQALGRVERAAAGARAR